MYGMLGVHIKNIVLIFVTTYDVKVLISLIKHGSLAVNTHHFQGQSHQPLLCEKHTIALYWHQHLKSRSIVCDQVIIET